MKLELLTTLERPDLIERGDKIVEAVWPKFMLNDAVANEYFFKLYKVFPQYQFWLLDGEEIVVSSGNYTFSAVEYNDENFVWIQNGSVILDYSIEFERWWSETE